MKRVTKKEMDRHSLGFYLLACLLAMEDQNKAQKIIALIRKGGRGKS